MAGNVASLQIKIDVDSNGNVILGNTEKVLEDINSAGALAAKAMNQLAERYTSIDRLTASIRAAQAEITAAAKAGLDTSAKMEQLGQKKAALAALKGEVAVLSTTMKQAQQEAAGTGEKIKNAGDVGSAAFNKITAAVTTYLSVQSAEKILGVADGMTVMSAKIDLATDSAEEQQAVMQQLYSISQNTRTEIETNAAAFFGYKNALDSTGASSKEVLNILDMVNKSLRVSGATTSEASAFVLQFKQALQSGVLQGDEFRSMMENNGVFAKELAAALDTDIAGLRAMSTAGELTTAKLKDAFPAMADSINASFESIPATVSSAWTTVENAFAVVISGSDKATGGTDKLADGIGNLAITVEDNAPAINGLFTGLVTAADLGVRSISLVTGSVQMLISNLTVLTNGLLKSAQGYAYITDAVGITDDAVGNLQYTIDSASDRSAGLAEKAYDNFKNAFKSAEELKKANESYKDSIAGSSAAVLDDIAAQEEREGKNVASIERMSKAEQKAAKERTKVLDEMYKSIGGEDYYRREADKVLAHVAKLAEAGATQEQQAQYTYEKIADLSAAAWKKGETSAAEYLDQLKGTLDGAVDLETAAQAKREAVQAASVDKMVKKEQEAADERAKVLDEMFKGIGGEEYYRNEAEKVFAHVEVLRQAGATQQEEAQYTYGKISELSEQAWSKGEAAAAKYLDSLKATMASAAGVTEETSKAQADAIIKAFETTGAGANQYYEVQKEKLIEQRDSVIALTGDSLKANQWYATEIEKLKDKVSGNVTVKVDADASGFSSKASSAGQEAGKLDSTTATVKIDADTEGFDSAVSGVSSSLSGIEGQFSVNTESASSLRTAIEQLNDMPTLDPFGQTRKKYQELLKVVAVQEQITALETNQKLIESQKESTEERINSLQEYYDYQEEAAQEAYDNQKSYLEAQLEAAQKVKESIEEELEARKEALEEEKDILSERIDALKQSMDDEASLRSAYEEIYSETGAGGLDAYKAKAEDVYIKAQEFKEKGVRQALIEQYVQKKLQELRDEATEAGITGLGGYIKSLENSYRTSGEFSAETAKATDEIKSLESQIGSLSSQIDNMSSESLDAANLQIEALETNIKSLEQSGIEEWFYGGEQSANSLLEEIKQLDAYITQLESQERVIKVGIETRTEAVENYQSGKSYNLAGFETFDGGGYTGGGGRFGGIDGKGGFLAILHPQETVVDHTKPGELKSFAGGGQATPTIAAAPNQVAGTGTVIHIGSIMIEKAVDVDGLIREIRRRAVRT